MDTIKEKVVIRAAHRTMYFESREAAERFLEDTKSWKIEEWTLEDEKTFNDIQPAADISGGESAGAATQASRCCK